MEKFVTSKDLAERLKAAGYNQSTEFNWCRRSFSDDEFKLHRKGQIETREVKERYAAPLSDELLEVLPHEITIKDVTYYLSIGWPPRSETFVASYSNAEVDAVYARSDNLLFDVAIKRAEALPDALALLWLYLHDHNLLPKTREQEDE